MKYIPKLYLIIIFVTLLILSSSILFFAKESQRDKIQTLSHHISEDFHQGLVHEKAELLSFSLALAESGALKNSLMAEDEQRAYEILSEITKRFKTYTHIKTLRIQLLDREFFIFAQSWGNASVGLPMWWFRDDLRQLKENKRPKVGMETGRRLTFKATIPMRNGREIIGYLEVIKFVDEFAQKLHQQGIELFALMEKKYLKQASLMQSFPFLKGYIIANKNFNIKLKRHAQSIDWRMLQTQGYLYHDSTLYLLETMYNSKQEAIGKYLLILPPTTLTQYQQRYPTGSPFARLNRDDVEGVVRSWENPAGSYRTLDDHNLIAWLPQLRPEDKAQLIERAKVILRGYSKDELIDIIIQQKHQEIKRGVVQ